MLTGYFLFLWEQLTDTVLMVAMNIISSTDSNLIDPSRPTTLTPEDVRLRVFGSKMVLLAEQMQCITIWLTKACLLLMYHRLTYEIFPPCDGIQERATNPASQYEFEE